MALGLVGSCATALALASPAGQAPARRTGQSLRPAALPPEDTPSARLGLRLMSEAAVSCQTVTYRGQQIVAWWEADAATASVVEVWHRRGSGTLVRASQTADEPPAIAGRPDIQSVQDEGGILWESPRLVTLMRANYQVLYAGRGSADNRPAQIVELRRPGGSLAARFWLDDMTKLPLRREIFDTDSRMISEDAFISLELGTSALGVLPDPDGQAWSAQLSRSALAGLRSSGWPLPSRLGDGLQLIAASHTSTSSGEVVDLSYSDGLSLVSLFVQRGQLPQVLRGWHTVTAGGRTVLAVDADERSLAWSARGFVYTVIADAPAATVGVVVAALPHEDQPGFWERMSRGFRRLVSWANPFG